MPPWLNFVLLLSLAFGAIGGTWNFVENFFRNSFFKASMFFLFGLTATILYCIVADSLLIIVLFFSLIVSVGHLFREAGIYPRIFLKFKFHYENLKKEEDFTNLQSCVNYFSESLKNIPLYKQFSKDYIGDRGIESVDGEFSYSFKKEIFKDTDELAVNLIKSYENLSFWTFLIENDQFFLWKRFPPNAEITCFTGSNVLSDDILEKRDRVVRAYSSAKSKRNYIREIALSSK